MNSKYRNKTELKDKKISLNFGIFFVEYFCCLNALTRRAHTISIDVDSLVFLVLIWNLSHPLYRNQRLSHSLMFAFVCDAQKKIFNKKNRRKNVCPIKKSRIVSLRLHYELFVKRRGERITARKRMKQCDFFPFGGFVLIIDAAAACCLAHSLWLLILQVSSVLLWCNYCFGQRKSQTIWLQMRANWMRPGTYHHIFPFLQLMIHKTVHDAPSHYEKSAENYLPQNWVEYEKET